MEWGASGISKVRAAAARKRYRRKRVEQRKSIVKEQTDLRGGSIESSKLEKRQAWACHKKLYMSTSWTAFSATEVEWWEAEAGLQDLFTGLTRAQKTRRRHKTRMAFTTAPQDHQPRRPSQHPGVGMKTTARRRGADGRVHFQGHVGKNSISGK